MVLQATLQKKRAVTQALWEERDRVAKDNMARLLGEERVWNEASNRAMYDLLVVSFFFTLAKSCI